MDKEGEGRSRAASQSAVGERGPIRMGERLGGLFKTGEGGTKVPGPFKAVVRLVVYPSARTHRSFRRNAVLSRLRWPEELLGDHGGFRSPEPFGVPLGCAAARGLFYLRAALRRPGLAGSAPRGAICGPAEQKHGGGAAPPPFWCGAGAAAAAAAAPRGRGWWRCRGQRRDSLRGGERGRPPAGARAALPGCGARGGAHPRPCGDGNRAPSPCRRGAPGARGSRPRRCGIAPRRGAGARFPLSAPPGAAAAGRPAGPEMGSEALRLFRQLNLHLELEGRFQPRERGLSLIECAAEVRGRRGGGLPGRGSCVWRQSVSLFDRQGGSKLRLIASFRRLGASVCNSRENCHLMSRVCPAVWMCWVLRPGPWDLGAVPTPQVP